MSQYIILNDDVVSVFKTASKKVIEYGKKGDKCLVIWDYDDIKIVENTRTGERFSVHSATCKPL